MKSSLLVSATRFTGISLAIMSIGLLIGGMIVMLPPMAAVGVVGIVAVVLVWVAPEFDHISVSAVRKVFLAFIAIQICVPTYYAVQLSGLPWISVRRIIALLLILFVSIMLGTSFRARRTVMFAISENKLLSFCIFGFLGMAFLSIFTSESPSESVVHFSDSVLNWYMPMIACLVVVNSEKQLVQVLKLIGIFSLFVESLGIVEFMTQNRVVITVIPKSILAAMMNSNPELVGLVTGSPIRNGLWRASSIYIVPLSFGEFAVMVAPIGVYFLVHGAKWTERALGFAVLIGAMIALFVSGSRGGSIGFVIALPIFAALWIVRYSRSRPKSLVGAISTIAALLGTVSMFAAIFFIGRLHKIVLGGGETASSNDDRLAQWQLGIPHILANPVTGNGFGMGADVVGFHSPGGLLTIDSYVLTVVVEMGIPGLAFFFGMVGLAIFYCVKLYVSNPADKHTAIAAPLACSLIAFGFYRIALSQRENHTLFFIFLGLVLALLANHAERAGRQKFTIRSSAPRANASG